MKIKGWKKFQHFKDRKPPWIKLYREILDDVEWHNLSGDAAKSLIMLWLIASECDGSLPDNKTLAFRLRVSENSIKSIISKLSHWLIHDDINLISVEYQSTRLETEREREVYKEEKETEEEWLSALRLNPAYKLINIENELNKMKAWCEVNKKIPSKRRFVNWLNRVDQPISKQTTPKKSQIDQIFDKIKKERGEHEPDRDTGVIDLN